MTYRKLSNAQKETRKHRRTADKKNAKIRAEVPLFADQIETHTPAGEYWHWRRNVARAAEHVGQHQGGALLACIQEATLRRFAKAAVGPQLFARLDAHRWRVYPPTVEYGHAFWQRVLTHHRPIDLGMLRSTDEERKAGAPLVRVTEVYPMPGTKPPMTPETFLEAFPMLAPEPPGHDDGGLDAHLAAFLTPGK